MKIRLVELVGPRCQGLDDGKKLYDLIFPEIKNGRSVELDFSDVELVFSPFLMGAIGKLLNHFEKDTIMQRLVLGPISEEHLKTVNDFLDRADQQDTARSDVESMRELFEEDELGDSSI